MLRIYHTDGIEKGLLVDIDISDHQMQREIQEVY